MIMIVSKGDSLKVGSSTVHVLYYMMCQECYGIESIFSADTLALTLFHPQVSCEVTMSCASSQREQWIEFCKNILFMSKMGIEPTPKE